MSRVVDAIASEYHYDASKDGTKAQFAKAQVIAFLKRTVKDAEKSAAFRTAGTDVEDSVETDIAIS